MNSDRINQLNGIGVILRFITPVLVTIGIFIMTLIIGSVNDVKVGVKELAGHFQNHLGEHKSIEVKLENRLASIETILNRKR